MHAISINSVKFTLSLFVREWRQRIDVGIKNTIILPVMLLTY